MGVVCGLSESSHQITLGPVLCKNHQWVKSLQDTGLDWFESRVSGGAHTERTIAYYTIHRLYIPLPGIGNGAR